MRKLKVFGGHLGGRNRTIVACYSLKNCADTIAKIQHRSNQYHYIKDYWAETGNENELKVALANPFVLITLEEYTDKIIKIEK
jgi:hypothetical protein